MQRDRSSGGAIGQAHGRSRVRYRIGGGWSGGFGQTTQLAWCGSGETFTQDVAAAALPLPAAASMLPFSPPSSKAARQALESSPRQQDASPYPHGVQPEPIARPGIQVKSYNGTPSAEAIARLNRLIDQAAFEVHVAQTFPLARAADAHRAVRKATISARSRCA